MIRKDARSYSYLPRLDQKNHPKVVISVEAALLSGTRLNIKNGHPLDGH